VLRTSDVTACLVTRGDQPRMMERILDSLIFDYVVVHDNSRERDVKTYGRYQATVKAPTGVYYFQDDDCLVPRSTQEALLACYEPCVPTAVYAHGATPAGYDDLPLVCGGAIVDERTLTAAEGRWHAEYDIDDDFLYYCDFAIGVLYPLFKQVRLPFEIVMEVAQDPSRLCNQPFAVEMKARVTERAQAIRDGAMVAA
jgi:hypothetical protein